MSFWDKLNLPTQDLFDDIEYVNPNDAYRLQIDVLNKSSELYAELEEVDQKLQKAEAVEKELVRAILAQKMDDMKGTQTRTNDLVDAFVYAAAANYVTEEGETVNLQPKLRRLRRKIIILQDRKNKVERRIRALSTAADICDRILNWNKHLARLEGSK